MMLAMLSSPGAWIVLSALFSALAAVSAAVAGWTTLRQQDEQIETVKAWLTGGNSYGYYVPLRRGGRLGFFIRHGGDYPAYDVTIRVQDGEGRLIEGPMQLGTLTGGSGMEWLAPASLLFPDPPPAGATQREFRIEIAARNGITIQRLQLTPVAGRWHTNSKDITKAGGGRPSPKPFPEAQEQ